MTVVIFALLIVPLMKWIIEEGLSSDTLKWLMFICLVFGLYFMAPTWAALRQQRPTTTDCRYRSFLITNVTTILITVTLLAGVSGFYILLVLLFEPGASFKKDTFVGILWMSSCFAAIIVGILAFNRWSRSRTGWITAGSVLCAGYLAFISLDSDVLSYTILGVGLGAALLLIGTARFLRLRRIRSLTLDGLIFLLPLLHVVFVVGLVRVSDDAGYKMEGILPVFFIWALATVPWWFLLTAAVQVVYKISIQPASK